MKKFKINKKRITALLLASGISLVGHSVLGEANINEETRMIKVTGNFVNVRTEPSTDTKKNIIGKVNKEEMFEYIDHIGEWYLVDYYGTYAYINDAYGIEITIDKSINTQTTVNYSEVLVAKITGNNVNIRSSTDTSSDKNIIGFADITDSFKILGKENNWYIIDYLGKTGYIYSTYVNERIVNEEDLSTLKMVYLTCDSPLYSDTNGTYLSTLPKPQYLSVIKYENGYYKVRVDGVIGYVNPKDTAEPTKRFVVSDLGRQMVRVFVDNKEVHRAHQISGRKSMQTESGVYKIGHRLPNYQLTKDHKVNVWLQYNGNIGFHDAEWQNHSYFLEVANDAFERFASGKARTYPCSHGSHGCDNLEYEDAKVLYDILRVGDTVIVIVPNYLIKDHIPMAKIVFDNEFAYTLDTQKVKKLV